MMNRAQIDAMLAAYNGVMQATSESHRDLAAVQRMAMEAAFHASSSFEILAALEDWVTCTEPGVDEAYGQLMREKARAAIAKARGEQP